MKSVSPVPPVAAVAALALAAVLALLLDPPLLVQAVAALLLTALLPGALWGELLVPRASGVSLAERALYAIGLGYAHLVIVLLGLSYLPGGLSRWLVLGTFGGLLILLMLVGSGWARPAAPHEQLRVYPRISASNLLFLFALLLIGGVFRFTHLGYAEFQGDEATVMLRAADAIAGREDALTSHLKGPVEILLPTAIYALTSRIDEATARLPFALANLAGLIAIWRLGVALWEMPRSTPPQPSPDGGGSRDWANEESAPPPIWGRLGGGPSLQSSINAINRPPPSPRARGAGEGGLPALLPPLLLALDGYFIAFSRIVQYQSVVFLMTTLTLLALVQVERGKLPLRRGLLLAALLLATGLLAHYEAGLVALPGAYLLWRIGRRVSWANFARAMIAPLGVGAALLAAFYVPFIRHPAFDTTLAYITVNRIGIAPTGVNPIASASGTFPYNNLADVFARTTLYSSLYHVALWVTLLLAALIWLVVRRTRGIARWGLLTLLAAGAVVAWGMPGWAWLLFTLAIVAAWALAESPGERVAWLWFGGPLLLSIFFIRQPNTHVYGFFMGWALVAGFGAAQIFGRSASPPQHRLVVNESGEAPSPRTERGLESEVLPAMSRNIARAATGVIALLLLVQANYAYLYFVHHNPEILRTWMDNRPPGYPVFYEMPTTRSIFGFPLHNGWQTIGWLYDLGVLDGPFATNAKAPVADWYARGPHRCERDPRYVILADTVEPADDADLAQERRDLEQTHNLFGTVLVQGEERLRIYTRDAVAAPQVFNDAGPSAHLDAALAHPLFIRQGPLAAKQVDQAMDNELNFRFGEAITLLGYTLPQQSFAPGERVPLTLFWRAIQPVQQRYVVTVQLVGFDASDKIGQLDGEPACGQAPTSTWLPGDPVADVYSIPLIADAAPGRYRVLVALYERETGARLPIATTDGQPLGDALGIDEIYVK